MQRKATKLSLRALFLVAMLRTPQKTSGQATKFWQCQLACWCGICHDEYTANLHASCSPCV